MIIYSNIIPFNGYKAMAIWPFIFVRGNLISEETLRHERIHFKQQKELLLIFFYILYVVFWIMYGYKNNPFEREAYNNDKHYKYLKHRKHYAWLKYLKG